MQDPSRLVADAESAHLLIHHGGTMRGLLSNLKTCGAGVASLRSGYEAVKSDKRRPEPKRHLSDEDTVLNAIDRRVLQATTRDLWRNYVTCRWLIRKHLDYCATFLFRAKSGNATVDQQVTRFMQWWQGRANSDVARRHRLDRAIRLAELMAVLDGDIGAYRINGTGRVQWIEGDRIRNVHDNRPRNVNIDDFKHGVRVDPRTKETRAYMIAKRDGYRFTYQAIVPARHIHLHGFFERFDQRRGISPLAPAIKNYVDQAQFIDLTMARQKISQLFAATITQESDEGYGAATSDQPDNGENGENGNAEAKPKYDVDFGKGPVLMTLDPGDKLDFKESSQPAQETQDFLNAMIQMTLKALDIPMHFYDESRTTWHGARGALISYMKSCASRRADLKELLDSLTRWRLLMAVADGEIVLPSGFDFDEIDWEWRPAGVPFWDRTKEARGAMLEIASGLNTFQGVVKETNGGNGDVFENITENAAVVEHARQLGYPLSMPDARAFAEITRPDGDRENGGDDE